MSNFKLRPHHALCIQFFKGKGYDLNFAENMQHVIKLLETNPEIEIVSGADMLCSCCPNLKGNNCTSCETVNAYDNAVCNACGFSYGDILTANNFFNKALEKIIIPDKRSGICGDCQWSELCSNPIIKFNTIKS